VERSIAGLSFSGREQLPLALELLEDVGLEIRARRDVGDFQKQREQRCVVIRGRFGAGEEQCAPRTDLSRRISVRMRFVQRGVRNGSRQCAGARRCDILHQTRGSGSA